jgi:hypothetical protein
VVVFIGVLASSGRIRRTLGLMEITRLGLAGARAKRQLDTIGHERRELVHTDQATALIGHRRQRRGDEEDHGEDVKD